MQILQKNTVFDSKMGCYVQTRLEGLAHAKLPFTYSLTVGDAQLFGSEPLR